MRVLPLVCLTLLATACGEPEIVQGVDPPNVNRGANADPNAKPVDAGPPSLDLQETEFVESDRSRDPFRSFAKAFVNEARGEVRSQREVLLDQYSIEELKLIGIISRIHPEKAMLVDPTGVGHVIQRGQFIGRATVVQPAGGVGAAYEVNWRVDRIRDGDVVLVRDDPSNPEVPSSTRVLQLRTDEVSSLEEETSSADLQTELAKIRERLQSMESSAAQNGSTGAGAQ